MSTPSTNRDPRIDQAAITDESLLAVHEKALGKQPDEKARYKLLPLNLLFIFSGLIFFAGTYLNRYSGMFDPHVFDENAPHRKAGEEAAPPQALSPEETIALGKKLYNDGACNTCHQPNGMGTPPVFPPLAGSEWLNSEERMIRIMLYGLTGPITVKGVSYNNQMPPFGKGVPNSFKPNWTDDRIAAVATYVRQDWGNQAPPITTEKVAEIHAKEGSRGPMTAAELEKLP